MERPAKERLIGAAVLVAAAVILIPEMLSGPKHEQHAQAVSQDAIKSGEPPLKTYTIDLSQSQPARSTAAAPQAAPEIVDESAPPPENAAEIAAPVDESAGTAAAPSLESAAESAPRVAAPANDPAAAPPKSPDAAAAPPAARSEAVQPRPAVDLPPPPTTGKGWAVQLGTFASQANAASLVKDMRGKGYEVFVMPVKSAKGTLYKVRVGPLPERAAADAMLRKVKTSVAGALVVPHP